jgi:hypothetical protein
LPSDSSQWRLPLRAEPEIHLPAGFYRHSVKVGAVAPAPTFSSDSVVVGSREVTPKLQ